MEEITRLLESFEIASGGHEGCAANNSFNTVIGLIAGDDAEAGQVYAAEQLGDDYDHEAADAVVGFARAVIESGRYANWTGEELKRVLAKVLGDAKANKAIEVLVPGEHTADTFVRTQLKGATVDQNKLDGKSFVNDDGYCDRIEEAVADGPETAKKLTLARHAREMVLHALYGALPNKELHEIVVK